jgi:hypothetical protein
LRVKVGGKEFRVKCKKEILHREHGEYEVHRQSEESMGRMGEQKRD